MTLREPEGWEEFYSGLGQIPERLKRPVPFVVKALSLFSQRSVKAVLDLGCGVGRHSIYLAKRGFDVVGLDASRNALKMAKAWSDAEEDVEVKLLTASMTNLPFVSGCFQAVVSISVIHHAVKDDVKTTVEEVHRVLEDGGVLLANLLSVEDYRYGLGEEVEKGTFRVSEDFEEGQFRELHHFSAEKEASNLLAGFREVSLEPIAIGKKDQRHCYWTVTAIK